MTPKQLISLLALSAVVMGYADPIKGETSEERDARLKRETSRSSSVVVKTEEPHVEYVKRPLMLLGKEICEQRFGPTQKMVRLYLGSSTSVTNVIAEKNMPCCTVRERFEEVKIGTIMTLSGWKNALSHSAEHRCMGLKSLTPEIERHRHEFRWRVVRE